VERVERRWGLEIKVSQNKWEEKSIGCGGGPTGFVSILHLLGCANGAGHPVLLHKKKLNLVLLWNRGWHKYFNTMHD
jgi:hypothetical protein